MVCDEIERDLAIRYETPRVCYHLMMGRTRDNPALRGGGLHGRHVAARQVAVGDGGGYRTRAVARCMRAGGGVARALWRGFVARRDRRVARLDSECRRLATCDDPTGTSALGAFTRGGAYTFIYCA